MVADMSMNQRTLQQLQDECTELGLVVKPSKFIKSANEWRFIKKDYVRALAHHHLVQRYGNPKDSPQNLKFRLGMDSPMLAFQYTRLRTEQQQEIWTSEDWIFTEKENGVRGTMVYNPQEGLCLYSRNISVDDYLPIDYEEKILQSLPKGAIGFAWAVDVEIKSTNPHISTILRDMKGVETESELQAIAALLAINTEDSHEIQKTQMINDEPLLEFKLIDVLYWKKDLRGEPYSTRVRLHDEAVRIISSAGLNIKHIRKCTSLDKDERKAFHEGILAGGGEGTVAANLNSKYYATPNRRRDSWVKIKRSVSESSATAGLGDTIDGFITGFEKADATKGFAGMVGVVEVTTFLTGHDGSETEHLIARCANIPLSLRRELTDNSTGEVRMKPEFYGKVVEVDGQSISPRARRLTHPRLIRFRDDKGKFECVMSEEFLTSMIL